MYDDEPLSAERKKYIEVHENFLPIDIDEQVGIVSIGIVVAYIAQLIAHIICAYLGYTSWDMVRLTVGSGFVYLPLLYFAVTWPWFTQERYDVERALNSAFYKGKYSDTFQTIFLQGRMDLYPNDGKYHVISITSLLGFLAYMLFAFHPCFHFSLSQVIALHACATLSLIISVIHKVTWMKSYFSPDIEADLKRHAKYFDFYFREAGVGREDLKVKERDSASSLPPGNGKKKLK